MKILFSLIALAVLLVGACIMDPEKPIVVHNTTVQCIADSVLVPDSLGNYTQRLCTYPDIKPLKP